LGFFNTSKVKFDVLAASFLNRALIQDSGNEVATKRPPSLEKVGALFALTLIQLSFEKFLN
jgi:hypothetical protein